MNFGFMVIARSNDAAFHMFGRNDPDHPEMITYAADADCHVILMGRLYYKHELQARLPEVANAECGDAALALATYRHLGIAGIEQLEGDFALAIWDSKQRRMIASREAMGGFPIYWLQRGETIAVATDLRPLVDLLPEQSLNTSFLGELLMLPNFEIDYFEETPFTGISRLVPGWSLTADLARHSVRQHEFWKWPERAVDPGTENTTEIADRYGELLRRAVHERLCGNVASHLSGGMDSTSVALLANNELNRDGRPLHALSLVYQNLAKLGDETAFLEEAINRPGIVSHQIPADDILDYDVFNNMPLHSEPIPGMQRIGLEMELLRAAAAAGADTVLTGTGADEMLSMRPFQIADMLKRCHLRKAWSTASHWAREQNSSVWSILRPYGLLPLMPAWSQAGLLAGLRNGYADWKHQNLWTIAPWVVPEFARHGQLRGRALNNVRRTFHSAASAVESEALERVRSAIGDWGRYTLAAPLGIVSAHPFRDLRVFSFALGIRTHIQPEPGLQKPILGAAMRDVLPESIRRRRGKTHYNSVYYAGLSRNQAYLETLVQNSPAEELGLFDKDCLLKCLQQAALGVVSPQATIGLDNTLSIVKWLDQLPEWNARKPEPSRVIPVGRLENVGDGRTSTSVIEGVGSAA